MKLLVSDYDGTIEIDSFLRNPYIPSGTISGIEEFMNNGNMFMIATARPYDSIMSAIRRNGIPYDYVSTLNGCIVHDKDGEIIYSKDMLELDIEEFYKLYSCIDKIELIKEKDRNLYYIFKTKLFNSTEKLVSDLKRAGFDIQSWFKETYNIVHPASNKVDSIEFIRKSLDICGKDVITVGDGHDDLKMIKNYYSYGIIRPLSNVNILDNCDKKVKSLSDSFKYINKNI